MAGNALPILLLGGAAAIMLTSKKKKKGRGWDYEGAPPAPSDKVAFDERNFVKIAFDGKPTYYHLGQPAVDAKVSGVDAEGFVYPVDGETLAGWYTRVAYWGAYPFGPLEIPPQCMAPDLAEKLGIPCDPAFIPYRDAVLRIYGLVIAEGKERHMNMNLPPRRNA